jgi:hypothetical protein
MSRKPSPKLESAKKFLHGELMAGYRPCIAYGEEIYQRADAAGISRRTLERASAELKVQKSRVVSQGTSMWALPGVLPKE